LEIVANQQGGNSNQFIATMIMRIKAMLGDTRMKDVIAPDNIPNLSDWLSGHVGSNGGENGPVAVIDLSLVPYEILHLVIAVSSRLILESLQRYRNLNHQNLPTVLVLEEAHTFVAKRLPHGDEIPSPADMCRGIFERVAREGRKFGLGLVLSSQRPSELSETVLSQCNSFLLHRITNDRDQELISRLVPDNARGLLRELPSLPTRHCILLGIASKVPALVEVKHLKDGQRPESDDPDFWNVWTNEDPRPIDWNKITSDWIGAGADNDSPQEGGDAQ
jgi:DNA helicase HerA-like ATPase